MQSTLMHVSMLQYLKNARCILSELSQSAPEDERDCYEDIEDDIY